VHVAAQFYYAVEVAIVSPINAYIYSSCADIHDEILFGVNFSDNNEDLLDERENQSTDELIRPTFWAKM